MAIFLRDYDSGREHHFLGTLETAASFWKHVGATIDVQLKGTTSCCTLASLVASSGVFSGDLKNRPLSSAWSLQVLVLFTPRLIVLLVV